MAKINVTGNAIVLTSSIKYADIEKAKKYRPEALKLVDKDGNEYFAIDTGNSGQCAQANGLGVVFNGKTHDENGFATNTIMFSAADGDLKEKVADLYGEAIINLKKLEEAFGGRIAEIDRQREEVLADITLS